MSDSKQNNKRKKAKLFITVSKIIIKKSKITSLSKIIKIHQICFDLHINFVNYAVLNA